MIYDWLHSHPLTLIYVALLIELMHFRAGDLILQILP